ncbi:MAG TPA: transposase [Burkholderiaceae bacterium]|jgi:putative transposase|nr:transposase [Burkholderiaceae bacterium]
MKKRYSVEEITGFLREAQSGVTVRELCRRHGFSEPSYYTWKAKYGSVNAVNAQRLQQLEDENDQLKRLLANLMLEVESLRESMRRR